MTLETLKAEAEARGYKLIPINTYERLLPCTCGSKRREHWSGWATDHFVYTLVCSRCGKKVTGLTEADARNNWNEMIREETSDE